MTKIVGQRLEVDPNGNGSQNPGNVTGKGDGPCKKGDYRYVRPSGVRSTASLLQWNSREDW